MMAQNGHRNRISWRYREVPVWGTYCRCCLLLRFRRSGYPVTNRDSDGKVMTTPPREREQFATRLLESRTKEPPHIPGRKEVRTFISHVLQLLFPHHATKTYASAFEIECDLTTLEDALKSLLNPLAPILPRSVDQIATTFMGQLPEIYETLLLDARAIYEGDPAAFSIDEVIIAYPGFFAIAVYRIAHAFYRQEVPIFPRIVTEYAHERTGIDIHPGAQIGPSFFIDHGTGIVVGETSVIKERVKLYQGVTLGALSVDKGKAHTKRHPTIESGVVIYSNATILGGDTVIGADSVIGGNVWLTESVPPSSTVYHQSEVKVRSASRSRTAE